MSERLKNALKNTFPDMELEVQKEMTPQTQLEELNDYLIMLAKMDTIGVRRKIISYNPFPIIMGLVYNLVVKIFNLISSFIERCTYCKLH